MRVAQKKCIGQFVYQSKMKIKFLVSALIIFIIITSFFTLNYVNKKKQKILNLENQIVNLKIEKGNVEDKIGFIPFYYLENLKLEIFNKTLYLKKYKTNLLNFTKGFNGKGSSYLNFLTTNYIQSQLMDWLQKQNQKV